MEFSDLVGIGRLGRLEPDGFYHVQSSQSNKSLLNRIQECFLIFSSNRVFFVTVAETKTVGQRIYLRFREDGIAEESKKHANVTIALAEEDLRGFDDNSEAVSVTGYRVHFEDKVIGMVADVMINPMQSVLIIDLEDGRELLVPNVTHYVQAIDNTHKTVFLQNIELLLEVCTSTS